MTKGLPHPNPTKSVRNRPLLVDLCFSLSSLSLPPSSFLLFFVLRWRREGTPDRTGFVIKQKRPEVKCSKWKWDWAVAKLKDRRARKKELEALSVWGKLCGCSDWKKSSSSCSFASFFDWEKVQQLLFANLNKRKRQQDNSDFSKRKINLRWSRSLSMTFSKIGRYRTMQSVEDIEIGVKRTFQKKFHRWLNKKQTASVWCIHLKFRSKLGALTRITIDPGLQTGFLYQVVISEN